MSNPSNYIDVTIASGQTTSSVIDMEGKKLVGIEVPATFTGTTVSFTQCRSATGTFLPVYDDDGNVYTVVATDGAYVRVDPIVFCGPAYVKIVSASAEGGTRTVTAVCMDL